jgi:hypothetical protein
MALHKNISGDWYISVEGGIGTIYVDGNLDVSGNITYVSEIAVNDAFIAVAANNNGTVTSMGLIATKLANSTYAGLRFNTVTSEWEISPSVYGNGSPITPYSAIFTGSGNAFVAGSDTQIQFNQGGAFGANGNLTFDYGNNKLTIQGHEVLGNIGSAPTAPSNAVALYNNAPGSGGTGLYVVGTSPTVNNDELVSLTKARLMAIIY